MKRPALLGNLRRREQSVPQRSRREILGCQRLAEPPQGNPERHNETILCERELAGEVHIVIDILHVVAIVEHSEKFFKLREVFRAEGLAGLRQEGDFLGL